MTFAAGSLLVAIMITLYAAGALMLAVNAAALTPHGEVVVPKEDIEVNWGIPMLFVVISFVWTLIAVGVHAL